MIMGSYAAMSLMIVLVKEIICGGITSISEHRKNGNAIGKNHLIGNQMSVSVLAVHFNTTLHRGNLNHI
jgi:hypothetical protein